MRKRPGLMIVGGGGVVQGITIDAALEHFTARLVARGKAVNTVKAYVADVMSLQLYLLTQGITLVGLIGKHNLEGWLDDCSDKGQSLRTQARRLTAVRRFLGHCRTEGWIRHEPEAGVAVSYRARRVTAPEMADLARMVDAIRVTGTQAHQNIVAIRDRAMLRLALDSGIRISEAALLDVPGAHDTRYTVDLKRHLVHVLSKGGDDETVAIEPATSKYIEAWLKVRPSIAAAGETALFVSQRGERFSRGGLHELIVRRAAAAGLGHVHWHLLRHRRIGEIYEKCGAKVAQEHARHAQQSTTENVYGRHAAKVAHEVVRAMAPLPTGSATP
jgi:site-specific recombinase XerD